VKHLTRKVGISLTAGALAMIAGATAVLAADDPEQTGPQDEHAAQEHEPADDARRGRGTDAVEDAGAAVASTEAAAADRDLAAHEVSTSETSERVQAVIDATPPTERDRDFGQAVSSAARGDEGEHGRAEDASAPAAREEHARDDVARPGPQDADAAR
jgi:hypothetical protein